MKDSLNVDKVSTKVEKLFAAHHLIIKNFGRQVLVYQLKDSGRHKPQVFNTVAEARVSCDVL